MLQFFGGAFCALVRMKIESVVGALGKEVSPWIKVTRHDDLNKVGIDDEH